MATEYFWTFRYDLPPGIGVKTFGLVHITWVAVAIFLMWLTIFLYKRQTEKNKYRILLGAVTLMVFGYVVRWIWLASIGHYTLAENLPLQLCSLSVFVELAAVVSGNITLKEFSYCCSMPGALASLIIPGMGPYPLFSYFYLQFAFAHTILILIPLLWIFGDGWRPSLSNFPKCAGLLSTFVAIAFWVNSRVDGNYFFLSHTRDNSRLQPFEEWLGYPGYLFPYVIFVFVAWVIMYVPWSKGYYYQLTSSKIFPPDPGQTDSPRTAEFPSGPLRR